MSSRKILSVGLVCLIALFVAIADLDGNPEKDAETLVTGPYTVERVVDGDTIILRMEGQIERVRLIGIDTPESVPNNPDRVVPYGKVAAEFTRNLLDDKKVELELDVEERDKYDRLLAYVYLNGEMVNKLLLREGHATVATYPPNVKYVEDFMALQKEAQRQRKGIWE
ncbi:micrococcal nuclease-like nuclease [Desulfitobacterium dichloroeliminans LMG P-21439]|uniref:Micrococcal nuclease-like nuclease n=1 Tax=Desulfitobacterium dichloroeliminans (strain LMG P-21439 / DCA1) TaxID=871963 RepID=L0F470_DESDL|nr:thermonuclease family protein [Desulfitobacterium dichloroeliminans]AGA67962.1 micrococcal nuclease-like nuclease [Desulfitobacterium dichloroeliminans LMG P-21439]